MHNTENHTNTNDIYENIWECLDKGVKDRVLGLSHLFISHFILNDIV